MISLQEGSGSSAATPSFVVSKIIHDVKYSMVIYGPDDFLDKMISFRNAVNNFELTNNEETFIKAAKKSGSFVIAPCKGKYVLELEQNVNTCFASYDSYKDLSNAFGQVFMLISKNPNAPLVIKRIIQNFEEFKKHTQ